jgi:transcriptional regulator with XRE-family HTH domain
MGVFGDLVKERRKLLGWSQARLAKVIGLSKGRLVEIEKLDDRDVHDSTFAEMARAFGLTTLGFQRLLDRRRRGDTGEPERADLAFAGHKTNPLSHPKQTLDSDQAGALEGLTFRQALDEAPARFNLGIAASGWVELEGEGRSEGMSRGRWIIIRVRGDSMEPRWHDGQSVMFQRLDKQEDSPVVGVDYFFVRSDGTGTFKRLAVASEDAFTLRALNKKYTTRLTVSREEVVMVAEARFIVTDPPDM